MHHELIRAIAALVIALIFRDQIKFVTT